MPAMLSLSAISLPLLSFLSFLPAVHPRDIPSNVQSFYESVVSSSSSCESPLASGFYSSDEGGNEYVYCGDHIEDFGIVYITKRAGSGSGTGDNSVAADSSDDGEEGNGDEEEQEDTGSLSNMDIDCDGAYNATTDDGRCGSSTDTQSVTSFQDTIASYNLGLTDLDANVHPYVVFGNVAGGYENSDSVQNFAEYDPTWDDIAPLSLMAVVCNNKLIYGIWGDYNGDDGGKSLVGEASISLATLCYGEDITGGNGHDEDDVLYIAFQGMDAVPGATGANWTAGDASLFEESLEGLGDSLVERISGAASGIVERGMKGVGYATVLLAVIVGWEIFV